ncbi:hypothetical protein [Vibrio owensii]|uniref:hypothetical protein n=1 Tax=Vibrio owensii TaxID=696485 RepID=UPI00215D5655|nr:hypothetical protein [Vibrio owensii]MCR9942005.1 hypothetical protein [Vibrio owensii]
MRVVPTGSILYGVCEIKSENCAARQGGAVTAIMLPDTLEQVNTCKVCLNDKVRRGEWSIDGAQVSNMKEVLDIALIDKSGNIIAAIEVKFSDRKKTSVEHTLQKMSSVNSLAETQYFIYASPQQIYIYQRENSSFDKSISKCAMIKPDLTEPMFADVIWDTPKSYLYKAKQGMLLERAFAKYFETSAFHNSLPRDLASEFESNQVVMSYVVKNT